MHAKPRENLILPSFGRDIQLVGLAKNRDRLRKYPRSMGGDIALSYDESHEHTDWLRPNAGALLQWLSSEALNEKR